MKLRLWAIALIAIGLTCSCKKKDTHIKVERAFYYWKSSGYSLEEDEESQLKSLGVKKLYVKFFEVEPDPIFVNKPISKTSLHFWANNDTLSKVEIVPTVYIHNQTLYNLSPPGIDSLADNIVFLIQKYYKEQVRRDGHTFKEIQIDCDWTKKTRNNYFALLKGVKKKAGTQLSCTLRLYPYKYDNAMGVPPADKAMLMCYNLMNPLASDNKNSILDNEEFKKYLKSNKRYPLHLDIALPIYSWAQVYRNNMFSGVINTTASNLLLYVKPIKPLWYEVQTDVEMDGYLLRQGDQLKIEDVTNNTLTQTISLLKKHIDFDSTVTVSFFHLTAKNLKYSNETLDSLYTSFSN